MFPSPTQQILFPVGFGKDPFAYIRKLRGLEPSNLVALFAPTASGIKDFGPHGYAAAPTAVTYGAAGIGDGRLAASYDGSTSFNNIYSAGLANPNLLSNPGFETAGAGGADVWANWLEVVGNGALDNETVLIHEGVDACKITAGADLFNVVYQNFTTVAGKKYRLRFWTRGDGTYAGKYRLYDVGTTTNIIGPITTGVTGTTYTAVVYEFTALSTSTRVYCMNPGTAGGIAYFDACEVRCMDGFLGDEGTLLAWAKVDDWTDGADRMLIRLRVDVSNDIQMYKAFNNNQFSFLYRAGGVAEAQGTGSLSHTDYACYVMTWSKSGDSVNYYIAGAASGSADTALGTWGGDLDNTITIIGADDTTPAAAWSGSIGPVALWNTALTADQIAYVSKP